MQSNYFIHHFFPDINRLHTLARFILHKINLQSSSCVGQPACESFEEIKKGDVKKRAEKDITFENKRGRGHQKDFKMCLPGWSFFLSFFSWSPKYITMPFE
uniref:Uncharacterized protein n=1 Tax=Micrurus spixii TaxID=129469 RepID=A0A2D4LNE9_9SAUR